MELEPQDTHRATRQEMADQAAVERKAIQPAELAHQGKGVMVLLLRLQPEVVAVERVRQEL